MKAASGFGTAGRWRRAPLPAVREPFINTPLLALGEGPDGSARFWTSTHNMVRGSTGVLIDEEGHHRFYHPGIPFWHLPSAVASGPDTLWLCQNLTMVLKLTLSTGRFERIPTGAPSARVGQGPVYDVSTGKLFIVGSREGRLIALSFDTESRRICRLYGPQSGPSVMRFSFPNGDGTWSVVVTLPGQGLLRWDPKREAMTVRLLAGEVNLHAPLTARLISDSRGCWYFPDCGWLDPRSGLISRRGPRPPREMVWFGRQGDVIFGVEDRNGSTAIYRWETVSGTLRFLCEIPDSQIYGCELTRNGKIVVVSVYGYFYRFHAESGALELSRPLPTEGVTYVDTLCRAGPDRVVGSAFITQRFWEVNLRTGEGWDCGRVGPGWGEATQSWHVGPSVYLAVYTGGELVRYDLERSPRYPENPRVVARPPRGQRPVAAASDGRFLYYACTRPSPESGGVLCRFDTKTERACFMEDPIPGEAIVSLGVLPSGFLIAGTTRHADQRSGPPRSPICHLAVVNGRTLHVERARGLPEGVHTVQLAGALTRNLWLCAFVEENGMRWMMVRANDFTWRPFSLCSLPSRAGALVSAGGRGCFLVRWPDRVEWWDLRKGDRLRTLARNIGQGVYLSRVFADEGAAIFITTEEVMVLEGAWR